MDPSRVLIFAATMYLQTVGIFSASSIFLKEESINIEAKPNFIYFSMPLVNKINELEKYNKLIIKLQSFKATQTKTKQKYLSSILLNIQKSIANINQLCKTF